MPYLYSLLLILFMLLFSSTAHAYIDMGTGSYLIQILLASFLAVGLGIRAFWHKIKSIFTPKSSEEGTESEL